MQSDPAMTAWRDEFELQGIHASISLPIVMFGKVVGIFGLYATTKSFFDEQEISLLEEATGDISFALENFAKEKMRIEAGESLKTSELRLQEAQIIAKVGSWEIDMVDNNHSWSNELYNIFGAEKVAPSVELFLSFMHPEDAAFAVSQVEQAFATPASSSFSFRFIRKDGIVRFGYAEWRFELDKSGKPLRLYGIVQDVTERKKEEEQLVLFASIVNSSDDAILSKTLDGKITSWNHGAERVFGYSAEEVISKHISLLIPFDREGEEKMILDKIRKGESVDHYETQRIKKDGKIIDVSLTVSPIRDTLGHVVGASKILRDITERKRAQEEIIHLNENLENRVQERTAELTEANKDLEAFTSTVSHDLRAPVRAVTSFATIIQQDYGDRMDPKEKELFGYIEDSGKRMSAIIDDLLRLAKYGNEKLKLEPVDMTRLVEGIWLNISRTTTHHAKLDLQELLNVQVDMSMLQQVVVNLLSNAIKYSSKKDKPVISVWCEKANGSVTFYFRDNGAGFDMKNYDRLFGAFQRFHSLRDFEGTGVGLTLVKRIIEKHGGTVGAEAKVGEGATFYFILPLP